MNTEKFNEAMNEVDEKYVDEAIKYKKAAVIKQPRRFGGLIKGLEIAACCVVAFGLIAGIAKLGGGASSKSDNGVTHAGYAETTLAATRAAAEYSSGIGKKDYGMNNAAPEAIMDEAQYQAEKSDSAQMMPETTAASAETAAGGETAQDQYSKIIYTATLSGETTEFDKTMAQLEALVKEAGGYFEAKNISERSGSYRYAGCTIRVPASAFESFCNNVNGSCHVTNFSTTAENVSERYYDIEVRLQSQRIKLGRLQELLERADDMVDIIEIENAISDCEVQIEYLTGSLRHYDSLIGYSTVYVNISEVYNYTEPEPAPLTLGQRISAAFARSLRSIRYGFEDTLEWFAEYWFKVILWAAVIFGAVKIIIKLTKKRREG